MCLCIFLYQVSLNFSINTLKLILKEKFDGFVYVNRSAFLQRRLFSWCHDRKTNKAAAALQGQVDVHVNNLRAERCTAC